MSKAFRHIHFIGICGTAMGAVAAAMRAQGYTVTGSDAGVYPPMSTFLESKGIRLSEGYRAENIPAEADLIIVGNAISRGNPEIERCAINHYLSLPDAEAVLPAGRHNLVVWHARERRDAPLDFAARSIGLHGGRHANLGQGASLHDSSIS